MRLTSVMEMFCLAALSLWGNYQPAEAETLVWGITSFPPGYITSGPDQGQGYGDKLEKFMIEHLPQYDHEIVEYPNWERQINQLKQGPLVCSALYWYRPPKERATIKDSYLVSAPSGVFFQHDVVVVKSKRHLFAEEVSFRELLKNHQLNFGYNRPYGMTYNRILADHVGIDAGIDLGTLPPRERMERLRRAPNIVVRSAGNMIEGMIEMLMRNRVDYILEYDFMIKYHQHKMGLKDQLVSLPTREVKDSISRMAFGCSATPQGKKAIAAINQVLKTHRHSQVFRQVLSYLVPQGREKIYWQEYDKILDISK